MTHLRGFLAGGDAHDLGDHLSPATISRLTLWLRALTALMAFLLNMYPGRPVADGSLDSSWAQVIAHGLFSGKQWGVDLVFTYGPLGLLSPYLGYIPEIFAPRLLMQWVFSIGFGLLVWFALRGQSAWRIGGMAVVLGLFGGFLPGDAAWFVVYVLAAACLTSAAETQGKTRHVVIRLIALSILPGLLPVVKFSLFPAWCAWLAFGSLHLARRSTRLIVLSFILANLVIPLLAWIACGQSIAHVGLYVFRGIQVSLGYASAMGVAPTSEVAAFVDPLSLVLLALLLSAIFLAGHTYPRILVALVVVLSCKATMLRADAPHIALFPLVACIALVTLPPASRRLPIGTMAGVLACAGLLLGGDDAMATTRLRFVEAFEYTVTPASWQRDAAAIRDAFAGQMALPATVSLVGREPVDVLGHRQGMAYANHLNLMQRPVIQGYSAYSPALSQLNASFYGDVMRAPKWVLLSVGSIDGRLPLQDDAGAMMTVIRNYDPILTERGFILMRQRQDPQPACPSLEWSSSRNVPMAARMDTPAANGAVWARIDAKLSLYGMVKSALIRPPILQLQVVTADRMVHAYRLVTAIARDGFVVSPALITNDDLLIWSTGDDSRRVVSIAVQPAPGDEQGFSATATVSMAVDRCGLSLQPSKDVSSSQRPR